MKLIQIIQFVLINGNFIIGDEIEENHMDSIFNLVVVLCKKDNYLNKAEVLGYFMKKQCFLFGRKSLAKILRIMSGNWIKEVEDIYM